MSILPKDDWFAVHDISGLECPISGFWNAIHTDGGKENYNNLVAKFCGLYHVEHQLRPKKKAKWGAHIERLLGTVAGRLKEVLGASFSNSEERGDYPSEKKATKTLEEARDWLATFLWGEYHNADHDGIGMPPMLKYAQGLLLRERALGGGAPRLCGDPERLRRDLMPMKYVTVQKYGVRWGYLTYYDPVLDYWMYNPHPKNEKFLIRRHPDFVRWVFFLDPVENEYVAIPLSREVIRPYSEQDIKEGIAYCRDQGWDVSEDAIFRARTRLDEIEKTSEIKTKKERRKKSKKYEAQQVRKREARCSQPVIPTDHNSTNGSPIAISANDAGIVPFADESHVPSLRPRPRSDLSKIKLM
jgi:putative transposase